MKNIRIKLEHTPVKNYRKYMKYFLIVIMVFILESVVSLFIPSNIQQKSHPTPVSNSSTQISDMWLPAIGATNTSTAIPKDLTAKSYLTFQE